MRVYQTQFAGLKPRITTPAWFGLLGLWLIWLLAVERQLLAWGGRGHDSTTLVAIKVLEAKGSRELAALFQKKSVMLAHLSNVPDTYWKSLPREQTAKLNPTHWVGIDYVTPTPGTTKPPQTLDEMLAMTKENCRKTQLSARLSCSQWSAPKAQGIIGTAPFRIQQLANLLREQFRTVRQLQSKRKQSTSRPSKKWSEAVHQALTTAGLLSHFVGDLAQPMHTTRDYDGWSVGQGGLHAYFESKVVAALDLGVEQSALETALKSPFPATKLPWQPEKWAWELAKSSHSEMGRLYTLDKRYSLLKPSKDRQGLRRRAERKEARQVAKHYRKLVVERFAAGAMSLATVWQQAWLHAGSPELSAYRSYDFAFKPAPIPAP